MICQRLKKLYIRSGAKQMSQAIGYNLSKRRRGKTTSAPAGRLSSKMKWGKGNRCALSGSYYHRDAVRASQALSGL